MTGKKNNGTTQEKLWNLDDKLLKTPAHDELVLNATPKFLLERLPNIKKGLLNPDNWTGFRDRVIPEENEINFRAITTLGGNNNYCYASYSSSNVIFNNEPQTTYEIEKYNRDKERMLKCIESEKCLSQQNVDDYHNFCEYLKNVDLSTLCTLKHETPILGHNRFIIGYWDIIIIFNKPIIFEGKNLKYELYCGYPREYSTREQWFTAYIEAKPYIDSYGSVLRQIKTYEVNLQDRRTCEYIYLLTPDIRFKEAFESQGVGVISP